MPAHRIEEKNAFISPFGGCFRNIEEIFDLIMHIWPGNRAFLEKIPQIEAIISSMDCCGPI
jgi:hypothetical protein